MTNIILIGSWLNAILGATLNYPIFLSRFRCPWGSSHKRAGKPKAATTKQHIILLYQEAVVRTAEAEISSMEFQNGVLTLPCCRPVSPDMFTQKISQH